MPNEQLPSLRIIPNGKMHFREWICINVAGGKGSRVAICFRVCVITKHWQMVDLMLALMGCEPTTGCTACLCFQTSEEVPSPLNGETCNPLSFVTHVKRLMLSSAHSLPLKIQGRLLSKDMPSFFPSSGDERNLSKVEGLHLRENVRGERE